MSVFVVFGSGAREHAIAWKLACSNQTKKVFVSPGNTAIKTEKGLENLAFNQTTLKKISGLKPVFAVIGPEKLLAENLALKLEKKGVPCIGFPAKTAKLETSKSYARKFCLKHGVASPKHFFFSDLKKAKTFFEENRGKKFFVKADELCGGKGAFPSFNVSQGKKAATLLLKNKFCGKGKKIIVEEFLQGREATIMAFFDGKTQKFMLPSTDYKRLKDRDKGPNTGGMGVIAPSPFVNKKTFKNFLKKIANPTLKGIKKEKLEGKGIIYYGIMVLPDNTTRLIEYNMRFGDPEAEAVLPLLKTSLTKIFLSMIEQKLSRQKIVFKKEFSCTVVLATKNYPVNYNNDVFRVKRIKQAEKTAKVFHASTRLENNSIFTGGGRVFALTGTGSTLEKARINAYTAAKKLSFKGKHYRKDIGVI